MILVKIAKGGQCPYELSINLSEIRDRIFFMQRIAQLVEDVSNFGMHVSISIVRKTDGRKET